GRCPFLGRFHVYYSIKVRHLSSSTPFNYNPAIMSSCAIPYVDIIHIPACFIFLLNMLYARMESEAIKKREPENTSKKLIDETLCTLSIARKLIMKITTQ